MNINLETLKFKVITFATNRNFKLMMKGFKNKKKKNKTTSHLLEEHFWKVMMQLVQKWMSGRGEP